jgi:general secretion pathway protein C
MILRRLSRRAVFLPKLLAWTMALLLVAWVAADLIVRWTAPTPVSASYISQTDPRVVAQRLMTRAPMAGEARSVSASPTATPAPSATQFTLVGVATGFGRAPGFALIQSNQGPVQPYVVGESPAPGVTLVALHADRIELDRQGAREVVPLTRQAAPSVAPVATPRGMANLR